jgi:hypothetical protein
MKKEYLRKVRGAVGGIFEEGNHPPFLKIIAALYIQCVLLSRIFYFD